MNIKERLRHIAELSGRDRAMGRTTMIVKAAEATGGIVLAHNFDHAKMIEREFKVPARSMDINLHGFTGPFFLDHHAAERLLTRAADKIEQLETEKAQLEDMISQIATIAARIR